MDELLFKSNNLIFALAGFLLVALNIHWYSRGMTQGTKQMVCAVNWIMGSLGFRGLWFYLIWMTSNGFTDVMPEPNFYVDNRGWVIMATSFGALWGVSRFITAVYDVSIEWAWLLFIGGICLSFLVGML